MDTQERPRNWRDLRYQLGEENAKSGMSGPSANAPVDFFDTRDPRIPYPQDYESHPQPIVYYADDPFQHLGRIGYRKNTYQFRGPEKDQNNIYGGQHMKKTLWLEEMRRRIYAETYGIDAEIDASNIGGTAGAFYIKSREKKNPFITSTRERRPG